jgi:AsmA family
MRSNPLRRGGALRLLVIVLAVLALLGLLGLFLVDRAAAKAIETGGSYALGVPTRFCSTSVGLFSGEFALGELEVDNPPGFDEPHFLSLSEASTSVGFSKLFGDTIEIDRVEIRGVTIDLERKDGRANYDVILSHLQNVSGDKPAAQDKAAGESKQLVIRKLVLSDIKARLGLLPMVPASTITLPTLELNNVGTQDHGATVAQVFELLVRELLVSSIANGGNLIPSDVAKDLKQGLAKLEDLGKQGLQGLQEAGKALGDKAKDLGDGLKDLFGK